MTDEEFLMSLPQDLHRDEKIRRLEAYRQKNPQPEVEEEVVEEEVVEEPAQKSFIQPAPGSILSDDFKVDLSGGAKPISEMSLGEMQQELQPYQAAEAYKQRVESVAKPNETYAGFEGGEEFKYDIKPGEQPSYYKREKGSDNEWTPIDMEDDQWFDVGARVFKHFDYDEDAYKATQNILSQSGDTENVFNSFSETVGDLELNQKSIAGFENIDKIYDDHVEVTDAQQEVINTQNDFFMSNGQRDLSVSTGMFANKADFLIEEKAIPQLQAKFEGTGIKFEEAGLGDFAKVTLPNGDSKKFELRKGKEAYEAMNQFIGQAQEDYKELEK